MSSFSQILRSFWDVPAVHPGWPESTPEVSLRDGTRIQLRPLRKSDGTLWEAFRREDRAILQPVEPTAKSWTAANSSTAWRGGYKAMIDDAYLGRLLPLATTVNSQFAGQVTMGNLQHGVVSEGWMGYWVSSRYRGRGVATAAAALGVDHAFARVHLNRVTATYLPGNEASRTVLETVGFRREGYLKRALHIDGQWRDHYFVAINRDDYPTIAVQRLREKGRLL